jgi:hypothetical protein
MAESGWSPYEILFTTEKKGDRTGPSLDELVP